MDIYAHSANSPAGIFGSNKTNSGTLSKTRVGHVSLLVSRSSRMNYGRLDYNSTIIGQKFKVPMKEKIVAAYLNFRPFKIKENGGVYPLFVFTFLCYANEESDDSLPRNRFILVSSRNAPLLKERCVTRLKSAARETTKTVLSQVYL